MKLGITTFIVILIGLLISWFVLSKALTNHMDRLQAPNPSVSTGSNVSNRLDFFDGKQKMLHAGSSTYIFEYNVPKPKTVKKMDITQHREAQMRYWAQREGHKLD